MAAPETPPRERAPFPAIPYGHAFFKGLRERGCLYADKTRFLHQLEEERFVFFIRPRRFGKSCWLSLLSSYYDRTEADDFDAVFAGTAVGADPTPNRNRYVVLWFDFSGLRDSLDTLERDFEEYCTMQIQDALEANPDLFRAPALERILAPSSVNGRLNALFLHAGRRGIPLYVLVDEYDNFANTILAHHGAVACHSFTHGGGFYRSFFARLKAGAGNGSIERMFITGVSPLAMDDVTSGFNIGSNLSLLPEFNELLGFTEEEVRGMVKTYRDLGVFNQDPETALDTMREWYDGYRFAEDAGNVVYNTDMVLYYLKHSLPNKRGPRNLIDDNVSTDYGKLRHLLVVGRQIDAPELNGNFDLLREVIAEGQADSEIVSSFPLARLPERESFLSLLHYFGLLRIRGVSAETPTLAIPNQTVRRLLYGFLRDAYRDVQVFSLNLVKFDRLTRRMALAGDWRPAIERLSAAMAEQTGVRDYLQGEKMVQSFVAAYLGISRYFMVRTEMELAKGYADLVLEPGPARAPGKRYGYVIELKYLRRGAAAEQVTAAAAAADAQARAYLADRRLAARHAEVEFTGVVLVFCGWELVYASDTGNAETTSAGG